MFDSPHIQVQDFLKLESDYLKEISGKRPMIGYLCLRTPIELIEAYGAVPKRIVSSPEVSTTGYNPIRNDACSFCRQVPELLNPEPYRSLSGIIAGACCDQMRRLVDILNETLEIPAIIFGAPRTYNQDKDYFLSEMKAAFIRLGESLGHEFNENELNKAVKGHQQLRVVVNRKREKGIISPPLLHKLAGSCLPVNRILEFIEGLKPVPEKQDAVRLMLFGSIPSGKEIALIEEIGAKVVSDLTCLGDRAFEIKDIPVENPMEYIYQYYIELNNCPHRRPFTPLIDYAKQQIRDRKVDGIVYRSVKYCHPFGLTAKRFKEELGIPFLQLDDDLTLQATGSFRTRIGAFVEMLQAQKRSKVEKI